MTSCLTQAGPGKPRGSLQHGHRELSTAAPKAPPSTGSCLARPSRPRRHARQESRHEPDWAGLCRRPNISSEGRDVTVPSLADITAHRAVMSQWDICPRITHASAHTSGATTTPLPTPSPHQCLLLTVSVSCQSPRPCLRLQPPQMPLYCSSPASYQNKQLSPNYFFPHWSQLGCIWSQVWYFGQHYLGSVILQ